MAGERLLENKLSRKKLSTCQGNNASINNFVCLTSIGTATINTSEHLIIHMVRVPQILYPLIGSTVHCYFKPSSAGIDHGIREINLVLNLVLFEVIL